MNQHSLRIAILALVVLVATGTEALPNLDRVIATQLEEVASRPSDPAVHNDLGNLLVLAERLDEAESAYRKAKDLSPADASARFNLGLLLQQQERVDEAFDELDALIDIEPDHAWAHYQLGMLESDRGNRGDALVYYAKSFALDPALTFERNNPHIIDNELATEAILRSSEYRRSAATSVPRSYGEGARLRGLMLEAEETAEAEAEEMAEKMVEETKAEGQKTAGRSSSGSRPVQNATEPEEALPLGSAGEDEEEEGTRVLSNEDLAGYAAVPQSSGGRAARESERTTAPRRAQQNRGAAPSAADEQSRREAIRERLRGRAASQERPGAADRAITGSEEEDAPTPTPRYRPSRRSTASLHLQILDDAPVARGAAS